MSEKQIVIYDTTLRDGSQGEGISFSVDDKLHIAARLDAFGVHYIEGGWPGSNPKDIEFFAKAKEMKWKNAKITAFGSTCRANVAAAEDANLKAIVASGVKAAAIFGKSWSFHVENALGTTLAENLRMIEDSVRFLVEQGIEVIFDAEHFFDGYKRDQEHALATLAAAEMGGAAALVLCDTNGGSMPHEIAEAVADVVSRHQVPVGIHAHNDSGVAVANTILGVQSGCTHVQGTVNGFGERCGNADLCSILPNLELKLGYTTVGAENMKRLVEVSHYVDEVANVNSDSRQPFVGRSVFAHKGGIHVSALMKFPETYEHMQPEAVGNRRRVLVSELSGASNVLYKAEEYDLPLTKDSPQLRGVVGVLKNLEHQGYHFEGAEGSFEIMLRRSLGLYEPLFELIGFRLIIEKRDPKEDPVAEATIKLRVRDQVIHTVAEGNGPVNALDEALRKALRELYPQLDDIKLTDYKVRVLNEKKGTDAKVRVLIESADDGTTWGTVGVSTNIIEASWRALVDSIEYGLLRAAGSI